MVRAESNPNIGKGKDNASKDNIRGGPEARTGGDRRGGENKRLAEGEGDLQAIESLRGIFIDASRNAQPGKAGQPLYRFTADQIAQLRKQVTSSLPAKGTKLTKAQSDVLRQVASDVGVMSAEGNIGKVPGTISPEQAKTIFNAMMAIAENKPAKLLKSFDPSVMDAGLPFMQRKLKEGGEKLGRQAVRDRIEIDKRLKKIDAGLRKTNQTKKDIASLRTKKKTALASRQKKVTDYHETIDRAVAEGIMAETKAAELKKKFTNLDNETRIERDLKKKSDDIRFMPAGDVKRMVERFDIDNLKDAYDKLADDRTHGNEDLAGAAHQAWDELFPSGVSSAIVTKATASRVVDMSAKDIRQSVLEDYVSRVIEITKGIDTDRAKVDLRLERDLKKLKRK